MEKKGKSIETTVNLLPEPLIQHIQSFLNAKEAARTTLLSKPWYTAWSTRPTLDFDESDFENLPPESSDFEEFTTKTMQRYQDLNLRIDSFRLRIDSFVAVSEDKEHYYMRRETILLAHNLIVNAIKIGATDLKLDLPNSFIYPREVLESESIIRLSLAGGGIDGNCVTFCSRLKSLSTDRVSMKSDNVFPNILTSCSASIEELSLSHLWIKFMFSQVNPYELHKLKLLFLEAVLVDNTFFSDFASKLPCLKDLSLVNCDGYTRIEMVSTSLECIRLVQREKSRWMDKFDVPNIRKFAYSGKAVPSLSIKVSSTRELEFNISIKCCRLPVASWFLSMKRLLKKMKMSRITISLAFYSFEGRNKHADVNNNFGVVPKRVAVESLTIEELSEYCSESLFRLFGICCPKLITHYWLPESYKAKGIFSRASWKDNNESLGVLCNVLSANQNTFGLNEVKVEIYEEVHKDEWHPLVLEGPLDASKPPVHKCKVSFRLTWG